MFNLSKALTVCLIFSFTSRWKFQDILNKHGVFYGARNCFHNNQLNWIGLRFMDLIQQFSETTCKQHCPRVSAYSPVLPVFTWNRAILSTVPTLAIFFFASAFEHIIIQSEALQQVCEFFFFFLTFTPNTSRRACVLNGTESHRLENTNMTKPSKMQNGTWIQRIQDLCLYAVQPEQWIQRGVKYSGVSEQACNNNGKQNEITNMVK